MNFSAATMIDIQALPAQSPLPVQAATDYAKTALALGQAVSSSLMRAHDVAYGGDPAQRYDVLGEQDQRLQPALIFFHGGGWTHGYKEWNWFMAPIIAKLGMRLVSPNYRLAPQHRLPAAFDDALAAISHFCAHAQEYGADPKQIYLAGHSAGGHLALLAALRREAARSAGIADGAIRACLPISGIHDLHHPQPQPGSLEEAVYTKVLQTPYDDAPMSPLCWSAGNQLPIALSFGENDSGRVRLSNQRIASMLALQPAGVQLHCEPGLDHFATHLALQDAQASWYQRLAQMLHGKAQ